MGLGRDYNPKRMTLIAEFPTPLGFAICADSQETVTECSSELGEYEVRVTVQKITPIISGKYQIAICGGGNAGLIEGFIVKARRALEEQEAVVCTPDDPASARAVHRKLEQELYTFYANDVAFCPDTDKGFKLFIAASCPLAGDYALWISENAVLRDAKTDEPELNGWNHRLYEETAKRLFSRNMTMSQAVLASIYVLNIAKATSNYVKDPLALAMVDAHGIHLEKDTYIRTIGERLEEYEAWMNRIFLSCADTTLSVPELEDSLSQFKQSALELHRQHIDQQADATTLEELLRGFPQRRLPKGPIRVLVDGRLAVEHDRKEIQAAAAKWKKVKLLGGGPFKLTVHCKCGKNFQVKIRDLKSFNENNGIACEKCNFVNVVSGIALEDVSDI